MTIFETANLRDMGGLQTPYGRIKTNMLYRGPALYSRDQKTMSSFRKFPVDVVIDLRTRAEQKETPDVNPEGAEMVHSSVFDEKDATFLAPTKKKKIKMFLSSKKRLKRWSQDILETYKNMPFCDKYQTVFKAMDEGKRIYFHCAAGKDRTGICAMIIELAFGRSFDQCETEYLATNTYYRGFISKLNETLKRRYIKKPFKEFILSAVYAKPEYFKTAKDEILARFGSIEEYLDQVHGITPDRIEKWKAFYIEPCENCV